MSAHYSTAGEGNGKKLLPRLWSRRAHARGPAYFARHQYRDYVVYKALAKSEPDAGFRDALEAIVRFEQEDYLFWRGLSKEKHYGVNKLEILFFKIVRKVFGLVFTVKLLKQRAKNLAEAYATYSARIADTELRRRMERLLEHESHHERQLLAQLTEGRVSVISNIVLGTNDGLVELAGAPTGFSFALQDHRLIAGAGFITGIAASMSMASSAYMQARYDTGKDPKRAGLYTGAAYLIVVLMLTTPFLFFSEVYLSLGIMFCAVFLIVNGMSLYGAVILERNFFRQAGELFIASIGVGVVAFIVGTLFRLFSGV